MPTTPTYKDKELLLRLADGDEQAFAAFVREHTDSIYSYILRVTKFEQWAEELVQDVWLQVWLARQDFAYRDNPVAYLHTMARNRSIDWLRKNKRELRLQYHIRQFLAGSGEEQASDKSVADKLSQLLSEGINALPPQRKKIIELKQAGASYEQIADTLQISKNTVRNQMVSALNTLRELLRKNEEWLPFLFLYFFS